MKYNKLEASRDKGYYNTEDLFFKLSDKSTNTIVDSILEKDYQAFVYLRRYYSGHFNESSWYYHAVHNFEIICPITLSPIEITESGFVIKEFRDVRYKDSIGNLHQVYTIVNPIGETETINTEEIYDFLQI